MLCCVAETHFDEWIAQHIEALWPELFDPAFQAKRKIDAPSHPKN